MKLFNKVISALYSHSKSSFTLSKLRFLVLRTAAIKQEQRLLAGYAERER